MLPPKGAVFRVRVIAEAVVVSTGRPIMAVARNTRLVDLDQDHEQVHKEHDIAAYVPDPDAGLTGFDRAVE